ncbi:MAG: hypothetical protein HXM85_05270 [Neisseria sp.]|nr:hypothetical protein [Neisseria sp.]
MLFSGLCGEAEEGGVGCLCGFVLLHNRFQTTFLQYAVWGSSENRVYVWSGASD